MAAYVSYKVRTKTTHSAYEAPFNEVARRFRDFAWLHDKLVEKNKGHIVPPLPEKSAVQKYQMATDFIEQRRRALQVLPSLTFGAGLGGIASVPEVSDELLNRLALSPRGLEPTASASSVARHRHQPWRRLTTTAISPSWCRTEAIRMLSCNNSRGLY